MHLMYLCPIDTKLYDIVFCVTFTILIINTLMFYATEITHPEPDVYLLTVLFNIAHSTHTRPLIYPGM